jgi:hypothetical protein
MQNSNLLKFGKANSKLVKLEKKIGGKVFTYSLPAGYTCPGASLCKSRFDRNTMSIVDGDDTQFRCFAASLESVFNGFRENNDHNFAMMKGKSVDEMVAIIVASVATLKNAKAIRVHVSGDYFSADYMQAWFQAAAQFPHIRFYSYTKSIHHLVKLEAIKPSNFVVTCSEGGKFDSMIGERKTAKVVFSIEDAVILGLQIDHDDSHAAIGDDTFALLIHGGQASGTAASKGWGIVKKQFKTDAAIDAEYARLVALQA